MLTPFLDIMHRILRTSLFPRVGDLDKIHSYLVNMILLCQEYRGTTMTLDICSIMYEELYTVVMERKVPIYGPYLQMLFEKVWSDTYEDPLRVGHLTKHEVVQLRIKANWAGGEAAAQGSQLVLMRRWLMRRVELVMLMSLQPVVAASVTLALVLALVAVGGLPPKTWSSRVGLLSSLAR